MLKTIAVGIAIAMLTGGAAPAQIVRPPILPDPSGPVLIKHDKDNDRPGRGRKLGHYKNRGSDDADDEDRGRRSSSRSSRRSSSPAWVNPAPAPYYQLPGYGTSYPPYYDYDYYGRPYYRGY